MIYNFNNINQSIDHDQFLIVINGKNYIAYLQAIFKTADCTLDMYEALIRQKIDWETYVTPDFTTLSCEEICQIDAYMLEIVIKITSMIHMPVSFNTSVISLPSLMPRLIEYAEEKPDYANYIIIEITDQGIVNKDIYPGKMKNGEEREVSPGLPGLSPTYMNDKQQSKASFIKDIDKQIWQQLAMLQQYNYKIAVDDIEDIGYSVLEKPLIDILAPDFIKININQSHEEIKIVQGYKENSALRPCQIIAERVEWLDEILICLENNIDLMQGYLFSNPNLWYIALRDNQHHHRLDPSTEKMINEMMEEVFGKDSGIK